MDFCNMLEIDEESKLKINTAMNKQRTKIYDLEAENKKLKFMIDEGLGWVAAQPEWHVKTLTVTLLV